jgi:hypothetical protein
MIIQLLSPNDIDGMSPGVAVNFLSESLCDSEKRDE